MRKLIIKILIFIAIFILGVGLGGEIMKVQLLNDNVAHGVMNPDGSWIDGLKLAVKNK